MSQFGLSKIHPQFLDFFFLPANYSDGETEISFLCLFWELFFILTASAAWARLETELIRAAESAESWEN